MELLALLLAVGNIPNLVWQDKSFPRGACVLAQIAASFPGTENPEPFPVLGCAALLSDESSSDEEFENNASPSWACILARIAFTFPDTDPAWPFLVGILEELEELDGP